MNLREWGSNSKEFMKFVVEHDKTSGSTHKVLGVTWNSISYTLVVPGPSYNKNFTKREVLQVIASIFDPLGYYSPVILKAKLFMQDLWKDKWEWDAKPDDEKLQNWLEIMDSLKTIPQYITPRYIGPTYQGQSLTAINLTLLCFCDASARAYATVVYLLQSSSSYRKVDLMFSKTRLAPKKITIPRLELLGSPDRHTCSKVCRKRTLFTYRQQDSLDRFTVCLILDANNQTSTGFCK